MKTLFLKSNLLHIRTNEGEFEVSNPEIIGDPETIKIIFNDGKPFGGMPIEPVWPGGVELNWRIAISTARDTKYTSCTEEYAKSNPGFHSYAVAQLLPKEEKKDFETVLGDSIKAHGINNDLPGHLIEPDFLFPKHTVLGQGYHIKKDYNKPAESDYKEPQDKEQLIGLIIDDFKNGKEIFVTAVESSEPHEDRFNQALREVPQDIKDQVEFEHNAINEAWELWGNIAKKDNVNPQAFVFGYVEAKKKYAVSAPSESQEEMYSEVRQEYLKHRGRIWTKEEVMLKWIIENYKLITRNP